MKSSYRLIILLLFLFGISTEKALPIKRIIFVLFPGGKTQHADIKELIDYSIQNPKEYSLEYHIIVYEKDYPLWYNTNITSCSFYQYGNGNTDLSNFDRITGPSFISHYSEWLHSFSQLFLSSKVMSQLHQKIGKNTFDMIMTDISNYISVLIQKEFNIPLKVYLSPRSLPQLIYDLMELNTNYVPAIGSEYNDRMNFYERFNNFFIIMRERFIHWQSQKQQVSLFEKYNYTLSSDMFMRDSFNLIQYPQGLGFPLSTPPNVIFLNAINIKESKPITNAEFTKYSNSYKKLIYMTEEAFNSLNKTILEKISEKEGIGFITQSEKNDEVVGDYFYKSSEDRNDLIALSNNLCVFSMGDINIVSQSLYHTKPVIILEKGIMQKNTLSYVLHRKLGAKVDLANYNYEIVHKAITEVCLNQSKTNEVRSNVEKVSQILIGNKNAKTEYVSWVNYGFKHSYKTLIVPLYEHGNWFQINCLDVFLFIVFILVTLICFFRFIFNKMFGTCKKDKKQKKIKKD